jgi:hypothetical protein
MAEIGHPLVDELIGFVKASKRGFCHGGRARGVE